jgi:hypothetical protein
LIFDEISLLLNIQRALFDAVAPSLRAVIVNLKPEEVTANICFVYNGIITEKLFDLASCATAEIDFPSDYFENFNLEVIREDFPKKYPIVGLLAYQRFEKIDLEKCSDIEVEIHKKVLSEYLNKIGPNIINEAYLILLVQKALLGAITPSLRAVTANLENEKFSVRVCFIYDGLITDELADLVKSAVNKIKADLPLDYHEGFSFELVRVDFPAPFPLERRLVYKRYEGC